MCQSIKCAFRSFNLSTLGGRGGACFQLIVEKIEAQRGEGSPVSLVHSLFLNTMLPSFSGHHPGSSHPVPEWLPHLHLVLCLLPECPGAGFEVRLTRAEFACQLPACHQLAAPHGRASDWSWVDWAPYHRWLIPLTRSEQGRPGLGSWQ